MKKRLNVEAVCKAYNEARMQNTGRKNSPEKTLEILKTFGISTNLGKKMLGCPTLFQRSQREGAGRGNHKCYVFSYNPVHVSFFQSWLDSKKGDTPNIAKKDIPFEEECASYLKSKGYQLRRCVGFDEDKFSKDYPQLYAKYLIYENV